MPKTANKSRTEIVRGAYYYHRRHMAMAADLYANGTRHVATMVRAANSLTRYEIVDGEHAGTSGTAAQIIDTLSRTV